MQERIGVFLCECGPNIKDALRLNDVGARAAKMPGVAEVATHRLYCSPEGQEEMARLIRERGLTRVVFAGCSPREHEHTFRGVMQNAGLNPFHLQMANIREQCAWVIRDVEQATRHAEEIVAAAAARVALHEALHGRSVPVNPDVLVVGAGPAGMSAALTLAQKARKVFVVEKLPAVGGHVVRYGELAPGLECASCVLEPLMNSVLHDDRIEVLTHAEVKSVEGFFGSFTVTVRKKARYVDPAACIGCDACIAPCPASGPDPLMAGLADRRAIYYAFKGALPNVPVIDMGRCLRGKGQACTICRDNCPFGAVKYDDRDADVALPVGAVVLATGFGLFDLNTAPAFGHGVFPDVYDHLEMECLLNKDGPTGGEVKTRDGRSPRRVALINGVGSRTATFRDAASEVCSLESIKIAHLLRRQLPEAELTLLFQELSLPDKGAHALMDAVRKDSIRFVRVERLQDVRVEKDDRGLTVRSPELQGRAPRNLDMVVLGTALEGAADNPALAALFDVATDADGFFVEAHAKLDPVGTATTGIMAAGAAQWPRSMEAAVAQGQAAAAKILQRLLPGETLPLDPTVAVVSEEACSGCKTCLALCPYHALRYDADTRRVTASDILCRGCGACAAGCPSGAITAQHFTDAQILAEVGRFLA